MLRAKQADKARPTQQKHQYFQQKKPGRLKSVQYNRFSLAFTPLVHLLPFLYTHRADFFCPRVTIHVFLPASPVRRASGKMRFCAILLKIIATTAGNVNDMMSAICAGKRQALSFFQDLSRVRAASASLSKEPPASTEGEIGRNLGKMEKVFFYNHVELADLLDFCVTLWYFEGDRCPVYRAFLLIQNQATIMLHMETGATRGRVNG